MRSSSVFGLGMIEQLLPTILMLSFGIISAMLMIMAVFFLLGRSSAVMALPPPEVAPLIAPEQTLPAPVPLAPEIAPEREGRAPPVMAPAAGMV